MIAVVFDNGLSTINETASTNFTASFNIYNPPEGVAALKVTVVWDTSTLSLKTGTAADVVEGLWMKSFGATIFGVDYINNTGGKLDGVADNLLAGSATGNGTMFTVAFHAKAISPTTYISILNPNTVDTYLLNESLDGVVNIDAVVNGSVTVVIPEFSASVLLPLFLAATTIAIAAATLSSRKRRILHSIS
jgi:hypothetical protein